MDRLYTQPRETLTDRDRINAAFGGAGWKIGLDIHDRDIVTYTLGVHHRGWRDVEIRYDGDTMLAAILTIGTGDPRSFVSVDALLHAAGIPAPGHGDPANVAETDTYVCILTDHMTGAVLRVELLSEAPKWDTDDTTDGVWVIRKGRVNGGDTVEARS